MAVTIDGSASVTINSGAVLGITSGTAVASTSGTSIDFTSIPSWVKRITVMFSGVSLSSTANILVQGGVGGVIDSTGYASASIGSNGAGGGGLATSTAGYIIRFGTAASTFSGQMVLTLLGSNIWTSSHNLTEASTTCTSGAGTNTFSGTLDTIRITSTSTDTFDAGSINILYE
jgi:hypothetical protein